MRFLAERSPAKSAREWRAFWRSRGMRELADVVSAEWPPLDAAADDAREDCLFRIASLLGSRAPAKALADELGRVRRELGDEPVPLEDTQAAHAIAEWFERAART